LEVLILCGNVHTKKREGHTKKKRRRIIDTRRKAHVQNLSEIWEVPQEKKWWSLEDNKWSWKNSGDRRNEKRFIYHLLIWSVLRLVFLIFLFMCLFCLLLIYIYFFTFTFLLSLTKFVWFFWKQNVKACIALKMKKCKSYSER